METLYASRQADCYTPPPPVARLLLEVESDELGLELTDEFMLSPEQSTSAIIVHHPSAKYFNVK